MVETPKRKLSRMTKHWNSMQKIRWPNMQVIQMLSTTIGDQLASQSSSTQTLLSSKLRHRSQCFQTPTIKSRMIRDLLQLQNKSECLNSHQFTLKEVQWWSHKSKYRQRKNSAFRSNYKSHKSSIDNVKSLSSKNEKKTNVSEKKKRQSLKKFDNFKCYVSNKKHKRPQRKLQLPRRSVNNKYHNILVYSSRRDQKYLQSTTHLQLWKRARVIAI